MFCKQKKTKNKTSQKRKFIFVFTFDNLLPFVGTNHVKFKGSSNILSQPTKGPPSSNDILLYTKYSMINIFCQHLLFYIYSVCFIYIFLTKNNFHNMLSFLFASDCSIMFLLTNIEYLYGESGINTTLLLYHYITKEIYYGR